MKLTLHACTDNSALLDNLQIINNSDEFAAIMHATPARGGAMPDAIKSRSMSGGRPMASGSLKFICFMAPAP